VLEPLYRLTRHRLVPAEASVPTRCPAGDEFRPSLGCPPFHFLSATLESTTPGRIRIEATLPRHLVGKNLAVRPTVRPAPGEPSRSLPLQMVRGAGRILVFDLPLDATRRRAKARAQLATYVIEPLRRRFETKPIGIPAGAALTVGIAVSDFAAESGAGPTEFVLRAHWENGSRELLRESVPADQGGRWRDRRVDLADLGGRTVRFDFETTTRPGADRSRSTAAYPLWGAPQIVAPRKRGKRRNLILVSLDTVRADHLGGRRDGVALSPWFDRLASRGTSFRQAVSTFHSTTAAHMSLFTGLYPATHHVRYASHVLPRAIPTLPQLLARAGYATAAVTEDAMILAGSGFARGFDSYRENRDAIQRAGAADQTFSYGVKWLDQHPGELFFLFLHTYEAHSPYTPPAGSLEQVPAPDLVGLDRAHARWEKMKRRYAAEVRHTDDALARLFDQLRERGVLDDALVVITSDHGEEFGEHGLLGHAKTVYDEVLRIPLLFWAPGRVPEGVVVDEEVSLVDVAPTILELLDLPTPGGIPGRSLVRAMRGDPIPGGGLRFAEGLAGDVRMVTARTPALKWIWREDEPGLRAYDLRRDPREKTPIDDPEVLARGSTLIEAYRALDDAPRAPSHRTLDEKTRRKLEALGYVD